MYTQIPPDVPARDRQMIPMRTLESIADAVAFEVWGERVGRGVPVPLSDRRGTFAYLFGYVRGETRFPSIESVFDHLRELRRQADADLAADRVGTYRADLRDFGNRFGSVCVSATQDDPPVMWISHFLPTYFITAEDADLEAAAGSERTSRSPATTTSPQRSSISSSPTARGSSWWTPATRGARSLRTR